MVLDPLFQHQHKEFTSSKGKQVNTEPLEHGLLMEFLLANQLGHLSLSLNNLEFKSLQGGALQLNFFFFFW